MSQTPRRTRRVTLLPLVRSGSVCQDVPGRARTYVGSYKVSILQHTTTYYSHEYSGRKRKVLRE